jgi:SHS2 domain-containing protein
MAILRDRKRWSVERRAEAYSEREHPSDLFLEIHGRDPAELAENALFAFYDQIVELEGFEAQGEVTLEASGHGLDEALRSLLAEALFRFETEGFVAIGGNVAAQRGSAAAGGGSAAAGGGSAATRDVAEPQWRLSADLWGENADRSRHTLLHEVKAVTYHQLGAVETGGAWKATVLLDL